eukprot:6757779-Pyramimonas_sp.AAC.1
MEILKRQAGHHNIATLVGRLLMVRPRVRWQAPQDGLHSSVKGMLGNGGLPFCNDELFTDVSAFDLDIDCGMAGRAVVQILSGPCWFDRPRP